ncbi:MAG TPA: YhjD/YihY/BrkB family envelope integrity protein [Steroidobacteraceae bacterium]|nr:YhjD/YihY/BrkB family envelope integrity protein [Steroidobacteraceae bacterium]
MFHVQERLERLLFEPSGLPAEQAWAPVLRVLRYVYALIRDLWKGDLNLRAMSLVYTMLLAIVPLLAFAFSVLKGMGIHRDLEPLVFEFFRPVGDQAEELTARVLGFVDKIQSGVLGSLGLAFLIYTVISTIQKVEESLNFVWRVERPRSWARRVSEYLSLMIVGPILTVAALGLTASLGSTSVVRWLHAYEPFGTVMYVGGKIAPYLLVTALFAFMYSFIPNTRVRATPALVGGLAAGVLWVLAGAAFAAFVRYVSKLAVVYAGFAIFLTALIWLYLAWLIVLVGAQISFYVQNPQYLRVGQVELRLTSSLAERLALNIMTLVGQDYRAGKQRWTTNALAQRFDVPGTTIAIVIHSLESAGLLVATEDETWVPGRDTAEIKLAEIADAARRHHGGEPRVHLRGTRIAEELAAEIDAAIRERFKNKTLRDLVEGDAS